MRRAIWEADDNPDSNSCTALDNQKQLVAVIAPLKENDTDCLSSNRKKAWERYSKLLLHAQALSSSSEHREKFFSIAEIIVTLHPIAESDDNQNHSIPDPVDEITATIENLLPNPATILCDEFFTEAFLLARPIWEIIEFCSGHLINATWKKIWI